MPITYINQEFDNFEPELITFIGTIIDNTFGEITVTVY